MLFLRTFDGYSDFPMRFNRAVKLQRLQLRVVHKQQAGVLGIVPVFLSMIGAPEDLLAVPVCQKGGEGYRIPGLSVQRHRGK